RAYPRGLFSVGSSPPSPSTTAAPTYSECRTPRSQRPQPTSATGSINSTRWSSAGWRVEDPTPHIGQIYNLTGFESADLEHYARVFSAALGRTIPHPRV